MYSELILFFPVGLALWYWAKPLARFDFYFRDRRVTWAYNKAAGAGFMGASVGGLLSLIPVVGPRIGSVVVVVSTVLPIGAFIIWHSLYGAGVHHGNTGIGDPESQAAPGTFSAIDWDQPHPLLQSRLARRADGAQNKNETPVG